MAVTVKIPTPLRNLTGDLSEVNAASESISALVERSTLSMSQMNCWQTCCRYWMPASTDRVPSTGVFDNSIGLQLSSGSSVAIAYEIRVR